MARVPRRPTLSRGLDLLDCACKSVTASRHIEQDQRRNCRSVQLTQCRVGRIAKLIVTTGTLLLDACAKGRDSEVRGREVAALKESRPHPRFRRHASIPHSLGPAPRRIPSRRGSPSVRTFSPGTAVTRVTTPGVAPRLPAPRRSWERKRGGAGECTAAPPMTRRRRTRDSVVPHDTGAGLPFIRRRGQQTTRLPSRSHSKATHLSNPGSAYPRNTETRVSKSC